MLLAQVASVHNDIMVLFRFLKLRLRLLIIQLAYWQSMKPNASKSEKCCSACAECHNGSFFCLLLRRQFNVTLSNVCNVANVRQNVIMLIRL